jgi:hypothetical protein
MSQELRILVLPGMSQEKAVMPVNLYKVELAASHIISATQPDFLRPNMILRYSDSARGRFNKYRNI